MAEPAQRRWTTDEFFAGSERQSARYECVGGRPLMMRSGESNAHDEIVVNLIGLLGTQVRGAGYRVFSGHGSVETYRDQIRRPDVGVEGGRRNPDSYRAQSPRVVGEVLSPSQRDIDSLQKLEEYKAVASLAHILFVKPSAPLVALWARGDDGAWRETRIEDIAAHVALPAVEASLAMREIYDGVEFPPEMRLVGPA